MKSGYWHNFRFNPALKAEGKDAFILDSKEPTESYQDFLDGEVRYKFTETCKSGKSSKTVCEIRGRSKRKI